MFLYFFIFSPIKINLLQLSKDIYDENEDISYTWVREYHWDVCEKLQLYP